MPRNDFNRRRDCPPNRFRKSCGSSRRGGFTGWGVRTLSNLIVPERRRSAEKGVFSDICAWILVGIGLVCAMLVMALFGPLGALLGLVWCGWQAKKDRSYLP